MKLRQLGGTLIKDGQPVDDIGLADGVQFPCPECGAINQVLQRSFLRGFGIEDVSLVNNRKPVVIECSCKGLYLIHYGVVWRARIPLLTYEAGIAQPHASGDRDAGARTSAAGH